MTAIRLLISLTAIAAFAQPTPPVDAVKAYLNLTATQVQALLQVRQQEAQAIHALAQQLIGKEQALRDALAKRATDAASIGKMVLEVEAARKQIQAQESSFRDQAVNLLTADQKAKLKTLEEAAKLRPGIEEAFALNLLELPAPRAGAVPHAAMGPLRAPRQRMPHRP